MSVYYVQAPDMGLVKIGYADNPAKRIHELQVGSPTRLILLAIEDGDKAVEAARHEQFQDLRRRGEWFAHEGELAAHIESLTPYLPVSQRKPLDGPLGAWMHENGHTVRSAGKLFGISPATVSQVCAGITIPRRDVVRRIFEVTRGQVAPNDLYGLTWQDEIAFEVAP